VAIEASAVPFRGGGILGDVGVFGVDGVVGGDVVGGVDMYGSFGAVCSGESESAAAARRNDEFTVVMGEVVGLAEQQEILQVGTAAVQPLLDVVGLQALGGLAAGMRAAAVIADQ